MGESHASAAQAQYLAGLAITPDLAAGNSSTFSLEDGSVQHFGVRLRPWTDEKAQQLALQPTPPPSVGPCG